jgi:hypothetical protein
MLLQAQAGISDVQAIDRMTADLRWKYALGLAIDEVLCTRSSLVNFRARLHVHKEGERIFNRILERAAEAGVLKTRGSKAKVVLDTTPIFGKGAVEDTYNLLATGIQQLVSALARVAGKRPQGWAKENGLGRYYGSSIKGESSIDWSQPDARREFLAGIVADADRLLETTRSVREGLKAGESSGQGGGDGRWPLGEPPAAGHRAARRRAGAGARRGQGQDRVGHGPRDAPRAQEQVQPVLRP